MLTHPDGICRVEVEFAAHGPAAYPCRCSAPSRPRRFAVTITHSSFAARIPRALRCNARRKLRRCSVALHDRHDYIAPVTLSTVGACFQQGSKKHRTVIGYQTNPALPIVAAALAYNDIWRQSGDPSCPHILNPSEGFNEQHSSHTQTCGDCPQCAAWRQVRGTISVASNGIGPAKTSFQNAPTGHTLHIRHKGVAGPPVALR